MSNHNDAKYIITYVLQLGIKFKSAFKYNKQVLRVSQSSMIFETKTNMKFQSVFSLDFHASKRSHENRRKLI
jgi:hypothetical protein